MSLADTIIIVVGALVLFGPKKLPELARQLGKIMGELRRASNEFKFQMEEELRASDLANLTRAEARPGAANATSANSQLAALISPDIQAPATGEPVVNRVSVRAQQVGAAADASVPATVPEQAEAAPHA
jgi:sec-independent protein translocase protein TatB